MKTAAALSLVGLALFGAALLFPEAEASPPDPPPTCSVDAGPDLDRCEISMAKR